MPSSELHVIVIGGGIAGLCLAQGLKKAGISVGVYERDRTRTDRLQGYRLSLVAMGCRGLYECLPPHLYKLFVATCGKPSDTVRVLSEHMDELVSIKKRDLEEPIDACRSVSRITLREILLSGLDDVVHFNKAFTRYEEHGDKVTAFFEDGTSVTGDILIGADGGNSRVRKQFLPQAQRPDTGIRIIAGKVPLTEDVDRRLPSMLVDGVAAIMTPPGCGMFVGRQEFLHDPARLNGFGGNNTAIGPQDGLLFDNTQSYIMWGVCARGETFGLDALEGPDPDKLLEAAHRTCQKWDPAFHDMIGMVDPTTLSQFKIHYSLPLKHWETGRVTLIGDAIHSMPPMGGVGTSIGIRDASLLCRNLIEVCNDRKELRHAFHEYEVEMLQYGFAGVKQSMEIAEKFVADSAIASYAMEKLLRVMNVLPGVKEKVFATLG